MQALAVGLLSAGLAYAGSPPAWRWFNATASGIGMYVFVSNLQKM